MVIIQPNAKCKMRVISQLEDYDVPYELTEFFIDDYCDEYVFAKVSKSKDCFDDDTFFFGSYETSAQAKRVLKNIIQAYENGVTVYKMPAYGE